MSENTPELQAFSALLDAQPPPVREAFQYCLCLMMVEIGRMEMVQTVPGEASPVCVFETSAGESFAVSRPAMSQEQESEVINVLRSIPEDEGLL